MFDTENLSKSEVLLKKLSKPTVCEKGVMAVEP